MNYYKLIKYTFQVILDVNLAYLSTIFTTITNMSNMYNLYIYICTHHLNIKT